MWPRKIGIDPSARLLPAEAPFGAILSWLVWTLTWLRMWQGHHGDSGQDSDRRASDAATYSGTGSQAKQERIVFQKYTKDEYDKSDEPDPFGSARPAAPDNSTATSSGELFQSN